MNVKMDEAKVLDLIGKYLTGNMSPVEKEVLMRWVAESEDNRAFFDEMIQLWSVSAGYDEPYSADVSLAWGKVESRLSGADEASGSGGPGRIIGLPRRWLFRAAAILLVALLAAYGIWRNPIGRVQPAVVTTEAGEKRRVELPDGSLVWLNENSELRYAEDFSERKVVLNGEGFFEVTHRDNAPFAILSGASRTTVLGTSFNLRAYPGEEQVEVTVATGKVLLEKIKSSKEQVLLTAGEAGVYEKRKDQILKVETPTANADAWKEQRLLFSETPLRQVLRDLERYFGVTFEVTNERILNCTFSISTPFEQPALDEVLMVMEPAMALQIEQAREGHYRISGEGCATDGPD